MSTNGKQDYHDRGPQGAFGYLEPDDLLPSTKSCSYRRADKRGSRPFVGTRRLAKSNYVTV